MMIQLFYNFCFPDEDKLTDAEFKNYGFYYLRQEDEVIYSHTEFNTPDGIYKNIFSIKYLKDVALSYQHNNGDWVKVKASHYPTSAYPLLLPKVNQEALSYHMISEDTGKVLGQATLKQSGTEISERLDGNVLRRFVMEANEHSSSHIPNEILVHVPRSIDWGGAVSFLCHDQDEAVVGTNFKIDFI